MIILYFSDAGLPNSSIQIGDRAYYSSNIANNWNLSGENIAWNSNASNMSNYIYMGIIVSIQVHSFTDEGNITASNQNKHPNFFRIFVKEDIYLQAAPSENDYVFFQKPRINHAQVNGYYSSVKIQNKSTTKAELFAVSCGVAESSK